MIEPLAPLELDLDVACEPDHAFDVWAMRISSWWPLDHTVTGEAGLTVTLEPWVGGRIFERTASGVEIDWGEVTVWKPPRRLAYRWHLNADRADATDVEVTFVERRGGVTHIHIEHRGWERLGTAADVRRDANRAGWGSLLPCFASACAADLS